MRNLQIQKGYAFYQTYIFEYSQNKAEIYQQYGFSLQGSIGSKDWEVFAAILLNDQARTGDGADLLHYEVKSAILGSSFEYQYHRNHGLEKLTNDRMVDHVFIARNESYSDIEVWLVDRYTMAATFNKWQPELMKNYKNKNRQRFRRSITYGFVKTQGDRLLEINNGRLISPLVSS